MIDPRSWSPERKAAAALGALALIAAAAMPLLFRSESQLALEASSDPAARMEKTGVFRSRATEAPYAVRAGAGAPAAPLVSAPPADASRAAAPPALLAAGRPADRTRSATGAASGGGFGGAAGGAGLGAAAPGAAAAPGKAGALPGAADPADAARDWGRLNLDPFSQQVKHSLAAGPAAAAAAVPGAVTGLGDPAVSPRDDGGASGTAGGGVFGRGPSLHAAAAHASAASGGGGGGGASPGAAADVGGAQAMLGDAQKSMKKAEQCTDATRAHRSEFKLLNDEMNWTIQERVRERCPAKACGEMARYCETYKGWSYYLHRRLCYCDKLICRSRRSCEGMDEANCKQKRACDDPPVTCHKSKCG